MELVNAHSETIDEKIQAVFTATQRVASMEIGSDEFLDRVLEEKAWFEGTRDLMVSLNESLIECFSTHPQESLRFIPTLKDIHQRLVRIVDRYEKGIFGKGLQTVLDLTRIEARQLREIIDDVDLRSAINADSELQSLFSQL